MRLHAEGSAVRVGSYGPGYFVIGERTVRHSVILAPDGTVEPWPPAASADLDEEHLRRLVSYHPEVVLLGTGASQTFPPTRLLRPFVESGLGLEVMDTPAACRTWNVLAGEGRAVVAGMIPIGLGPPSRPGRTQTTAAEAGKR